MEGGGAVVLLVVLLVEVAAFNLDLTQPFVWSVSNKTFGYDVALRSVGSSCSLFVAAVTTRPTKQDRAMDETTWFQCSISGDRKCTHDASFKQENSSSGDTGIPLKTDGTEDRILEFERQPSGSLKVVVYTSGVNKTQIWSSEKEDLHQGGSYGQSWCKADLNNDGWDDLVVGEPLHSQNMSEQGRVFVYIGQKKDVFHTSVIIGKNFSRAFFGRSISCIGDVNLDRFPDVAVGAPGEPGGGAIYLYRGSASGLDTPYSQHIAAADVSTSLQGFGCAMSGGADVDGNHYNDVLVGASESRHAVLLRARPIVHLTASLNSSIAEVNNHTVNFNLTYTFSFYNKSLLVVEVVLQSNSLQCVVNSYAGCTSRSDGIFYNKTQKLSTNTTTSETINVVLKKEVQPSAKPIEVKISYSLVDSSNKNAILMPVVDPKDPREQLLKINHTLACGNDSCQKDGKPPADLDTTVGRTMPIVTTSTYPKLTVPEGRTAPDNKVSSSSKWIPGVIGGIVSCMLLATVVFAIFRRRRLRWSWKERVLYRNVGTVEFARFLPEDPEDTVSLDNEVTEDLQTPPGSLMFKNLE